MEKLSARLELKMKEETFAVLGQIHKKHRISPAELCRALAEAAVEYYKKNGRFGFPITLSEGPISPTSPVTIDPAPTPRDTTAADLKKHDRQERKKGESDLHPLRQGLAGKQLRSEPKPKTKPKKIGF